MNDGPDELPILVVDDDPQNLELIEGRLTAAGLSTVLVESGAQALAQLGARAFRAVLLDLRLPDVDGLEILADVRVRLPDLPVVIMTAHGSEAIAEKAREAGATDYLLKPIARRELLERLAAAIGGAPAG